MNDIAAPGVFPRSRFRINLDFLVLAVAVVLINLPYFDRHFLPAHDGKSLFTMFSYFYNHVRVEHEFPLWMVYGTYGLKSAAFQVSYLTLSSYLSILGGLLLGVQDALTLFVVSMIGEQLMFLLGVYLLSGRLFKDRLTIFIVCFSAVCSNLWYWQIFFNFRLYALLPLTLYFLIRFTEERRPELFWWSGITLLLGGLGCPPYFYPLQALILALFAAGLGRSFRQALTVLSARSWPNVLSLTALILIAGSVGLALHQSLAGIRIESTGRDPASGAATLETFLTYGGVASPELVGSFLGVIPPFDPTARSSLTHYIGLLPLAALPLALLRCRSPQFIALLVSAAALLLLSLGGTFAAIAYRLPLLNLFRHVGAVTPLVKILLLLAGGFGIERVLAAIRSGLDLERRARFGFFAVIALLLWFITDLQLGGDRMVAVLKAAEAGDFQAAAFRDAMMVALRAAACLGAAAVVLWPARSVPRSSAFAAPLACRALLAAVVLDGLLFQGQVTARVPATHEPNSFPVGTFPYHDRRERPLDEATARKVQDWKISGIQGAEYYFTICSAFRIDGPRDSRTADGWSSEGVARLTSARGKAPPDAGLTDVLGVTADKLRLVSDAVYVDTVEEAEKAISSSPELGRRAVLRGVPKERQFAGSADPGSSAGSVVVKSFSANRLVAEVTVTREPAAWLVYADTAHPGWHALVDQQPASLAEAYLAFKAVRLDKGMHVVSFTFHDGIRTAAQRILALLATLGGFAVVAAFGFVLFPGQKGNCLEPAEPLS